ncbi:hypothetical protein NL108_017600 [Boleophthalmus pectinirostris]|nr:hypothetical protein NL108_017600 [Boleophthalmus pectinirostris]
MHWDLHCKLAQLDSVPSKTAKVTTRLLHTLITYVICYSLTLLTTAKVSNFVHEKMKKIDYFYIFQIILICLCWGFHKIVSTQILRFLKVFAQTQILLICDKNVHRKRT